jgi:hypothetical protein
MRVTEGEFEKRIEWTPAYDKRNVDPRKNYGVHGMNLRFILIGSQGAVQWVLYTNWNLPHVTKESMSYPEPVIGGDPHWRERPMPVHLGYHSLSQHYEGQDKLDCDVLAQGYCYYGGSSLNSEPVFEKFLAGGEEAVWTELKEYYESTFVR